MSLVKRNLIANLVGTGWSGMLTLLMAPVYIHLLGVEAYGLVGFQWALQAIVSLLDFGMAVAVNRELARLTASQETEHHARVVMRTAEIALWTMAAVVALAFIALAPLIGERWFTMHELSPQTVTTSLRMMGVVAALRLPLGTYNAGLLGLQRHTLLNSVIAASVSVRAAGSILLLLFVARDVRLVFAWEAVSTLLHTAAAALALHMVLPHALAKTRFDFSTLREAWRFARGVSVGLILGTLVYQCDRLAVSRLLPLSVFGHYTVGALLAGVVLMAVAPVQTTMFPRFSQIVALGNRDELALAYHRSSQTVAAMLLPMVCVFCFFGREVILLWTRDAAVAEGARWLAALLVCGAASNALTGIPYSLQLAHGWTGLTARLNAIAVVVMVPVIIVATMRFGAIGAAASFLIVNFSLLLAGIILTHSRLLPGHLGRWLVRDAGPPAVAALLVCGVARLWIETGDRWLAAEIVVVSAIAFAASALTTRVAWEWIHERVRAEAPPR
jgi:O-antigen/teichoic acid export membrane protein